MEGREWKKGHVSGSPEMESQASQELTWNVESRCGAGGSAGEEWMASCVLERNVTFEATQAVDGTGGYVLIRHGDAGGHRSGGDRKCNGQKRQEWQVQETTVQVRCRRRGME